MPVEYNIEFDTQHDYILMCGSWDIQRARYALTRAHVTIQRAWLITLMITGLLVSAGRVLRLVNTVILRVFWLVNTWCWLKFVYDIYISFISSLMDEIHDVGNERGSIQPRAQVGTQVTGIYVMECWAVNCFVNFYTISTFLVHLMDKKI